MKNLVINTISAVKIKRVKITIIVVVTILFILISKNIRKIYYEHFLFFGRKILEVFIRAEGLIPRRLRRGC